jgi:tRNA A-37 threonylcarbamoyl transferase component Bud32
MKDNFVYDKNQSNIFYKKYIKYKKKYLSTKELYTQLSGAAAADSSKQDDDEELVFSERTKELSRSSSGERLTTSPIFFDNSPRSTMKSVSENSHLQPPIIYSRSVSAPSVKNPKFELLRQRSEGLPNKVLWIQHSYGRKLVDDRLFLIKKIRSLLSQRSPTFTCQLFNNIFDEDKINITRIGSESNNAHVYKMNDGHKIKIDVEVGVSIMFDCAIKVMVIKDDNDYSQHEKEVEFAKMVSDLVLSGVCEYYPILLYSHVGCNNLITFKNSDQIKGTLYLIYKCIENSSIKSRTKRLIKIILNKINSFDGLSENNNKLRGKSILDYISENESVDKCYRNILDKNKLIGTIMVSELAWGDLKQLIIGESLNLSLMTLRQNIDFWKDIIIKIIKAIHHLPFIHNDLHLGNILLAEKKNNEWIPLIHDFGESTDFNQINEETFSNYVMDFKKFFDSLKLEVIALFQNGLIVNLSEPIGKFLIDLSEFLYERLHMEKEENQKFNIEFINETIEIIKKY